MPKRSPALLQSLMAQLPTVGPKLTSGMLFFLAAVKGGTVGDLFTARTLAGLDAAMPSLLAKLAKDVEALHQNFINSPLADWKAVQLPLLFGSEVTPARLYIPATSTRRVKPPPPPPSPANAF